MKRLLLGLLAAACMLVPPADARGPRHERSVECRRAASSLRVLEWLEQVLPDRGATRWLRLWISRERERVTHLATEGCVRLNQVQVLGTHNSYHVAPRPNLLQALVLFEPEAANWAYTHLPLDEQLATQGIRQLELDVFADPVGGLFARRRVLILVGDDPESGIPELDEPGHKVLHVQEVDFESTCPTLRLCLETVKTWSDANPWHLPLMILIEAKDEPIPDPIGIGWVIPVPFDREQLDALDAEILAVFPPERIILPDDVRGTAERLEDAVLADGWPTLGEARGRVLFALDNGGATRDHYRQDHPSLRGRVLFTAALPGDDDAAFVKQNDPLGDPALIPDLVETGYIVRTRADADLQEARSGDTLRRDVALASGAQFVSTDFPVPDPELGTGYFVEIPGGSPARCNPVNAPPLCRSEALERPP